MQKLSAAAKPIALFDVREPNHRIYAFSATAQSMQPWLPMRLHGLLALCSFVLPCALLLPTPATACWDGVAAVSERVEFLFSDEDADWSELDAQNYANWLMRIDALLPAGTKAGYQFGMTFTKGPDDLCQLSFEQHDAAYDIEDVFDVVAEACNVSEAEVAAAAKLEADVFTVQLYSVADLAKADSIASNINYVRTCESSWHGFYEAGGFPSINACAHVLSTTLDDGRTVHRVIVGNFLTRAEANLVRAELNTQLGRDGLVRRMETR